MNKLYSEIIHAMYLDYYCNYLTVEKFAEHNLLSVEHTKQILEVGRVIAHQGLKQYQDEQLY